MSKLETGHWLAIVGGATVVAVAVYMVTRKSDKEKATSVVADVPSNNAGDVDSAKAWIEKTAERLEAKASIGKKMATGDYDESGFSAEEVKSYISDYVHIHKNAEKRGSSVKAECIGNAIWGYFAWGAGKDLNDSEKGALKLAVEKSLSYKTPVIGGLSGATEDTFEKDIVSKAITANRFSTELTAQLKDVYSI